jgi:DNA polymerase
MTPTLHIDFETRSAVELKSAGVHVYAEDPSTDVWCAAYCVDDGPIGLWTPQDACPNVIAFIRDGIPIVAHNASFERTIWKHILTPRYGWPEPKLEQWRCTMVQALAMSLPASLDNATAAVGLPNMKDMDGHRLMMRMAKPRKRNEDGTFTWWDDAERRERLYAYCKQDVTAERELGARLLPLRPSELALWHLDQLVNDRGVYVDEEFCTAAKKVVDQWLRHLNKEMARGTDGLVSGVTKVSDLAEFCNGKGVPVDSVDKKTIAGLLARPDLPDEVRFALEIRQEGGKSSVAKINTLLAGRSYDNRARGLTQYHAASTGRWGGRRFQPQNLKRPDEETDIEAAIAAIRSGHTARTIAWLHGPPLSIVGDCIRGMVVAEPGNQFYVADFVSIEAVVLPWLAGEQWKLDAFRDYRAGRAPDLYIQSYCKTFRVPLFDKKDPRRQIGKVMELASGYQGGHGAYLRLGATGKTLDTLTEQVKEIATPAVWKAASDKYVVTRALGLNQDQWAALRIVVDAWRAAHPAIKQFWFDLQDAALKAVQTPGETVHLGDDGDRPLLQFKKQGSFLWLRLPSGRALCYPYPRVQMSDMPWDRADPEWTACETEDEAKHLFGDKVVRFDPEQKRVLAYVPDQRPGVVCKGVDAYTRKWGDCHLYGGLLAENVTQAVARDLLAEAMVRCEAAGYEAVLHVHDELVVEVPEGFGSLEEFTALMETVPAWAEGCPVAADGWQGNRYRKA